MGLRVVVPLFALSVASCRTAAPPHAPQERQLAAAVAPPDRLEPPASLPESARLLLRGRMASHARDMGNLVTAIMVLRYPAIRERAASVAADVDLARPVAGDANELNALLPAQFFALQDELRDQARALAAAAEAADAFAVANAYGRMSETCVRCHAVYRAGR